MDNPNINKNIETYQNSKTLNNYPSTKILVVKASTELYEIGLEPRIQQPFSHNSSESNSLSYLKIGAVLESDEIATEPQPNRPYNRRFCLENSIIDDRNIRETYLSNNTIKFYSGKSQISNTKENIHFHDSSRSFNNQTLNQIDGMEVSQYTFARKSETSYSFMPRSEQQVRSTVFIPEARSDIIFNTNEYDIQKENLFQIQGLEKKLLLLNHAYEESHIFTDIKKQYEEINFDIKTLQNGSQIDQINVKDFQDKNKLLQGLIEGLIQRQDRFNRLLNDKEGWQKDRDKDSYNLEFKQGESGSGDFYMRVSTEADIDVQGMVCLMFEHELMHKWVPFSDKITLIKEPTKASKLMNVLIDIPQLKMREQFLLGRGYDLQNENGTFILDVFSIDSDQCPKGVLDFLDYKIPKTKNMPAYIRALSYEFTPQSLNRLKVRAIFNIDNNLNFIPDSIMQWVTKMTVRDILKYMIKKSGNLEGTPWDKKRKMPEKKYFYDWLDEKVMTYAKLKNWV